MPAESLSAESPTKGLRVLLPDETEITVAPLTIRQARRALALYPQDQKAETALESITRLRNELDILLGPEHDGLADTLPPVTASDLAGLVWGAAAGCEPVVRQPLLPIHPRPSRPASELLAAVNAAALRMRAEFLPASRSVEEMPLADALRLLAAARSKPATP